MTFIRSEIRRARREEEAHMQNLLNESESDVWPQIAPLLDTAMAGLNEKDRNAIVLRFFEGWNMREVGSALGASEDAAKKRVNRAVEKLQKIFTKRGITLSAAVIAGAVSANSIQAAPVGLTISAVAAAQGSALTASTLALVTGTLKIMTYAKLKFAATLGVGMLIAVGAATAIVAQTKSHGTNSSGSLPSSDAMLIVPGQSVGKVRGGMTIQEVVAVLGEPENRQGRVLNYLRFGFSVIPSKDDIVRVVMCGDSGTADSPLVKAFKGRTKEGIGMKSSRADVIKAFGQPTTVKPWQPGQEQLAYKSVGLTFTLEKEMVFHIIVDFRKAQ